MQKDAELKKRGAEAMGFDQDKTVHHFRLFNTGGAIEVVTKDPADDVSRMQIRTHLKIIAEQFAAGDFGKPLATHGELPPGVRTMQERRTALTFIVRGAGQRRAGAHRCVGCDARQTPFTSSCGTKFASTRLAIR